MVRRWLCVAGHKFTEPLVIGVDSIEGRPNGEVDAFKYQEHA
jgi:hypothetical protein